MPVFHEAPDLVSEMTISSHIRLTLLKTLPNIAPNETASARRAHNAAAVRSRIRLCRSSRFSGKCHQPPSLHSTEVIAHGFPDIATTSMLMPIAKPPAAVNDGPIQNGIDLSAQSPV